MTYLARFRLSILLAACLAVLATTTALAHAIVTRTDPVDGAVLSEAPRHVRLWFSEEVSLNLSKIEVVDSGGQAVPGMAFHADEADPALVIIDLPDLKPATYRVAWDALSTDDLHFTRGSIVFGVQTAIDSAAAAQPITAPPPLEVIVRWLDFVALATVIGALALTLPVPLAGTDTLVTNSIEQRLLRLALMATGAALITSLGGVIVQAITLGGGSVVDAALQLLTQTSYGSRWLMREGWSIALLVIIVWQRRQPQVSRLVLGATFPLLFALVVLQAMNGHATSFNDDSLVRVVADALHLLGAGVWVGGLIALATAIVPLLRRDNSTRREQSSRRGSDEAALAIAILRRFGLIAASSLGVLLITGLYNSGQQVASLDALLFTLYGQSLLLKIGLVLGVGLIGLINSARLHPHVADVIRRVLRRPISSPHVSVPPHHMGRTVMIEALGAIGILLFAAVLGSSQPARGPEFDLPDEGAAAKTASANAADLSLTFSIKPNRPGQNFVSIGAFDTRRPAPAPIERVTVRFTPPAGAAEFTLDADKIGNGKYQITGDAITVDGDWRMTVEVQRPGLPAAVWTLPWTVVSPTQAYRRPVQISNQPIAPWLNLAAVVGTLIAAGGAGLALWRRRAKHTGRPLRESDRDVQSLRTG